VKRRSISIAVAGALAGVVIAVPGMASASSAAARSSAPVATVAAPGAGFQQAQQKLEQQLANRVTQLQRLSADVAGAKSLTAPHATLLNTRLGAETAAINALVAKVPTDNTRAELNTDRAAMLRDNRVYAVMTPQVIQTIEADSIAAEVATFQASEAALQAGVSSLSGQPGYQNALNHFLAFVRNVNRAQENSTNVAGAVLLQLPQDWPRDTHVFVQANHELLNAGVGLAYAQYDESIIGLATGGYTGP